MTFVRFDTESDPDFLRTAKENGADTADSIIEVLENMSGNVSWQEMIDDYFWKEILRSGENTYPGANSIFSFVIDIGEGREFEI